MVYLSEDLSSVDYLKFIYKDVLGDCVRFTDKGYNRLAEYFGSLPEIEEFDIYDLKHGFRELNGCELVKYFGYLFDHTASTSSFKGFLRDLQELTTVLAVDNDVYIINYHF